MFSRCTQMYCTVTVAQLCYFDTVSSPSGGSSYLGRYKNYWLIDTMILALNLIWVMPLNLHNVKGLQCLSTPKTRSHSLQGHGGGINRITYWSQGGASLPHKCQPPSPPLDNIRVMVIVWRLRANIIRTAPCLVVWQCSQSAAHLCEQFLQVQQIGFVTMHRGGCLELYYCNMVEWSWWDSSLIWKTIWLPSVLWHCWFGHMTYKNRPWYDV